MVEDPLLLEPSSFPFLCLHPLPLPVWVEFKVYVGSQPNGVTPLFLRTNELAGLILDVAALFEPSA